MTRQVQLRACIFIVIFGLLALPAFAGGPELKAKPTRDIPAFVSHLWEAFRVFFAPSEPITDPNQGLVPPVTDPDLGSGMDPNG